MAIGHNILTSLSASGPACSAHVGVCEKEGERKGESDSGMVYTSIYLLHNF